MAKAEPGTPKFIANRMKSRGLQKLKWFCQVCEKQCRDENGYKCHVQSESHQRQMLLLGENARKHIGQYSTDFETAFVSQLRMNHGEKKINANRFYNEYIQQKDHVHMNATRWASLSVFIKHLAEKKICDVAETEQEGLTIAYIDRSAGALERQKFLLKKNSGSRGLESTEIQEQKRIEAEVQRAREVGGGDDTGDADGDNGEAKEAILVKTDTPIKLSMGLGGGLGGSKTDDKKKKKINPFGKVAKVKKEEKKSGDKVKGVEMMLKR